MAWRHWCQSAERWKPNCRKGSATWRPAGGRVRPSSSRARTGPICAASPCVTARWRRNTWSASKARLQLEGLQGIRRGRRRDARQLARVVLVGGVLGALRRGGCGARTAARGIETSDPNREHDRTSDCRRCEFLPRHRRRLPGLRYCATVLTIMIGSRRRARHRTMRGSA